MDVGTPGSEMSTVASDGTIDDSRSTEPTITEPREPDGSVSAIQDGESDSAIGAGDAEDAVERSTDIAVPEPARSPAEAFAELAAQISHARRDIAQVADYARGTGAQLQRAYDDMFLEGADAAIRGLIRIDELLFKQTRETNATSMCSETVALATMLGQALEGELRSLEVHVLEPQPGDELDLARMVAIANRPAPLLRGRRVGTIAEIISRGYVFVTPQREKVLKKAEVVIWRARDEVAFEAAADPDAAESERGEHHE
jgi:hypothetical protein